MPAQPLQEYLVERCLAKDRQAQRELYRLYADAMFTVCVRMLKDRSAAQDAMQEAFVDAFTKLHTYRKEASFGSWLKRIVINRCLSELQRNKRMPFTDTEDEQLAQLPDDSATHEKDWTYEAAVIKEAIKELPDGARTVLNLYLFEGYSHEEIADILSVTISTSKAQYSKAKKRLRQIIESKTDIRTDSYLGRKVKR